MKKLLIELDTDDFEKINRVQQIFSSGSNKEGLIFFPKAGIKIYEIDELNNLKQVY